jgi:hypothetical protein
VTLTPARLKERDIFGTSTRCGTSGSAPISRPSSATWWAGFPAAQAGSRPGTPWWRSRGSGAVLVDLAETISRRPASPQLVAKRGAERVAITVTPRGVKDRGPDGKETEAGRIGISPSPSTLRAGRIHHRLRDGVQKTAESPPHRAGPVEDRVGQLDRSNIGGPSRSRRRRGSKPAGAAEPGLLHRGDQREPRPPQLVPVPMLDGGHLLFFVCEGHPGGRCRCESEKCQQVGFVL